MRQRPGKTSCHQEGRALAPAVGHLTKHGSLPAAALPPRVCGTFMWRGQYCTETHILNFSFQNPVALQWCARQRDWQAFTIISFSLRFWSTHNPSIHIFGPAQPNMRYYIIIVLWGPCYPSKFQTFCLYFVISCCENRMLCLEAPPGCPGIGTS